MLLWSFIKIPRHHRGIKIEFAGFTIRSTLHLSEVSMLVYNHRYFCHLAFSVGASIGVWGPDGATWDHQSVLGAALMLKVIFWSCMS